MPNTIDTGKIGKLGFGYMRLPRKDGKYDHEHTIRMADAFIESGGTYFDAAYVYDGAEVALRETVIKRYPRESIQIASKLPVGSAKSAEDMEKMLATSLERLGTDYIDFYLLHGLSTKGNKKAEDLGAWDYLSGLKSKGIIRHMGFSFHGAPEELDEILTKHPEAEFTQLQINYLDWSDPEVQSARLHEIACKHNVPIIVMEPLRGGRLASEGSPIVDMLRATDPNATLASWALRYVAQLEGVFVTLSGMSSFEQVADNIATYKDLKPLSEKEHAALDEAVRILNAVPRIACTDCKYCIADCPSKINIPLLIDLYNEFLVHNTQVNMLGSYRWRCSNGGKAGDCVACRVCEEICPQKLEIVDTLCKISEMFD